MIRTDGTPTIAWVNLDAVTGAGKPEPEGEPMKDRHAEARLEAAKAQVLYAQRLLAEARQRLIRLEGYYRLRDSQHNAR